MYRISRVELVGPIHDRTVQATRKSSNILSDTGRVSVINEQKCSCYFLSSIHFYTLRGTYVLLYT